MAKIGQIIKCKNCDAKIIKTNSTKIHCSNKCAVEFSYKKRGKNIAKEHIIEDLRGEIWKDIKGYEGFYQISNTGRVKSLNRERIVNRNGGKCFLKGRLLKPYMSNEYMGIKLCKHGIKTETHLHRLIAIHFIDNPKSYPCINHINGIKTDNRVENLEWCSYAKNNKHAYDNGLKKPYDRSGDKNPRAKYSNELRRIIFDLHLNGKSLRDISIISGIKSKATIHYIIKSHKNIKI